MNREEGKPAVPIRRIVVALDASSPGWQALEEAAQLAARWRVELGGLFIEDVELLRLAAAAAATRFLYATASEEPLSLWSMESELRALAERARQELGRAAARAHVRWSFRTVRGRLAAEIMLATGEADVLSLGGAGRPGRIGSRSTSSAGAGAAGGPQRAPSARRPISTPLPVLVVHDGSPGAEEALLLAAGLAHMRGSGITVLIPAPSDRVDPALEAEVLRLLSAERLPLRFRAVDTHDQASFLRAVRSEEGAVLVVSGGSALLEEGTIESLMREGGKALFIVGGGPIPAWPPAAAGKSE
jgi:nucleotide-binding universal stress UspA family protein